MALAAFVLFGVSAFFPELPGAMAFGIVLSLVILFSPLIGYLWARHVRNKADGDQAVRVSISEEQRRAVLRGKFLERQRLIDAVEKHRVPLTRNLERSIVQNDYGTVTKDDTEGALDEFFASIDLDLSLLEFEEAKDVTFEQLEWIRAEARSKGFDENNLPFDGHAFEAWVAESLEGFGWTAQVTKGGGDQGLDVIAEKSGRKIGLQCKLYSNAVGNKAVQEAHAGKAFYALDEVGVMTNAEFTRSATDLAQVTGVFLLSHRDIPTLDEKILGG